MNAGKEDACDGSPYREQLHDDVHARDAAYDSPDHALPRVKYALHDMTFPEAAKTASVFVCKKKRK